MRPKEGCTWYDPHCSPPEVRCLTPEVPARRGWGVLLTGAASAVAGIERARGAGLLVSRPGSGPGCGLESGPGPSPGGLRGRRSPSVPLAACQLAVDLRRPRGRCPEAGPRLRRSQLLAITGAAAPRVPLRAALRPGDMLIPLCPRVNTAPGVGGRQGSRLTFPARSREARVAAARPGRAVIGAVACPAAPPSAWLLPVQAARSCFWRFLRLHPPHHLHFRGRGSGSPSSSTFASPRASLEAAAWQAAWKPLDLKQDGPRLQALRQWARNPFEPPFSYL